ncbi:MAG: RrF2 family transcriptional regulator [Novosphingobium sp.]
MRLNQGVEWAVHACTVLIGAPPGRGLSLAALAEYHGVPAPYMAKQMQLLSKAGLVRTSRGKTGGYALARPANAITLWDVTAAVDGPAPLFRCSEIRQRGPCAVGRADCLRPCQIAAAFALAEEAWRGSLRAVTLADIAGSVVRDSRPEHMAQALSWLGANLTELPAAKSG